MSRLNLLIVFGGRTCEHDVSIISGLQAFQNADKEQYDVRVCYIDGEGDWYFGYALEHIEFYKAFNKSAVTKVMPTGVNGKLRLIEHPDGKKRLLGGPKTLFEAEVVMPVMHGLNGEDGTIQGMLELLGVPYTSSGILGSSVGLDKIAMKQVFRGIGVPVLPDTWLSRSEWSEDESGVIERIEMLLGYPVYVKPANLGSSIGISRADDRKSLKNAIDVAVNYDRRVLVEKGVNSFSEVNMSCLGYAGNVQTSVTEMPVSWEQFLTFDEKYLAGAKGQSNGMESLRRKIPAPIDDELTKKIERTTKTIFNALDCKGVVRIDYMIDKDTNNLYVEEINTIPGSLSFYLWEPMGISFKQLIDKLVEFALKASADKNRSVFSYKSDILKNAGRGSKGAKGAKL